MDARVLIALALTAGCMKDSKLYCEKHGADDPATCGYFDASIDARPTCNADPDCTTGRCETTSHYCVECLTNADCMNSSRPLCDPDTWSCQGCVAHTDCASGACLPNGVCGDSSEVAFVDPTGSATTGCSATMPCMKISDALATSRPFVKLTGSISEAVTIAQNVTLLAAPDTTLTRANSGVLIDIKSNTDVAIYDLRLVGNGDSGIVNAGATLRLTRVAVTGCNSKDKPAVESKGGTTIISRSQIYGNGGGGLLTDAMAAFSVTNTLIVHNGLADGTIGGAKFGATSSGQNRFELNTVADNVTAYANFAGVACGATSLTIPNNIISHNLATGDVANTYANAYVFGCPLGSSKTAIDNTPFKFVSDASQPWDYHIQLGSTAIDAGSTTDIGFDFDGDLRTPTAIDVGADELK